MTRTVLKEIVDTLAVFLLPYWYCRKLRLRTTPESS
jgi:hypothetical protein